jgi:hypothetical protein
VEACKSSNVSPLTALVCASTPLLIFSSRRLLNALSASSSGVGIDAEEVSFRLVPRTSSLRRWARSAGVSVQRFGPEEEDVGGGAAVARNWRGLDSLVGSMSGRSVGYKHGLANELKRRTA